MRSFFKELNLGCLTILLILAFLGAFICWILWPSLDAGVRERGHTLSDLVARLLGR